MGARRIMVITHAGGSPYHGPNMRWYYMGLALMPLGVEVEIVSSSFFHKYLSPPNIRRRLETERVDGLIYHWVKTQPYRSRGPAQVRNQLEFVYGCYRAATALKARRPDVVIASSPHPLVNFPAAAIARRAGASFMFEVRDLWPSILLELGRFSRYHPYIALLSAAERYGASRADRVISVKPGDSEYFARRYGVPPARFSYIPNGFLPHSAKSHAPPAVSLLRRQYRLLVGYVGALSIYYDLDQFLKLARQFRNRSEVGFVLVGTGARERHLAEKAAELENVHMVGPVPKAAVPACLDLFDVCYAGLADLAVHRYGISCNKIYEYMHAGKPIIGSYSTGHDPVSMARCGIIAAPGDNKAMGDGLSMLLDDRELREACGRRAREYFDAYHDFRVVAKDVVCNLLEDHADCRHMKRRGA